MRKLIIEIVSWLAIEFLLNLSGLSDLSNYGEFVFAHKQFDIAPNIEVAMVIY